MATLLIKNIHTLVTMDETRREIRDASLFIRDNIIEQVGTTLRIAPDRRRSAGFTRSSYCPSRSY